MYEHSWHTVEQGRGLECGKCDTRISYEYDDPSIADCSVSDEEAQERVNEMYDINNN